MGANDEARDFLGRTSSDAARKNEKTQVLKLLDFWGLHHELPKLL